MSKESVCLLMHRNAGKELGVHEILGAEANARIVEYASHTSLKATSDEVAWCSSFANFVAFMSGVKGTNSASARSWLDWGQVLDVPILGCIVVFKRGAPPSGHVAFCDHPDISNGIIRVIGGNQGDSVKVARFPVADVLGYRCPKDVV